MAIAAHTVTRATITDRMIATAGRLVNERAAAGGPIISEKISRAPTTGTVSAVAAASTSRNASSIRWLATPLASAMSGSDGGVQQRPVEDRDRGDAGEGEQSDGQQLGGGDAEHFAEQRARRTAVRTPAERLRNSAPSASPSTSARAVATSWRPRRPSVAIAIAAAAANAPSPISALIPRRFAAAAPANALFGSAWAGNAEPRRTTKNPTTPASTAMIVATIQVFVMKLENTSRPPARGRRAARVPAVA